MIEPGDETEVSVAQHGVKITVSVRGGVFPPKALYAAAVETLHGLTSDPGETREMKAVERHE